MNIAAHQAKIDEARSASRAPRSAAGFRAVVLVGHDRGHACRECGAASRGGHERRRRVRDPTRRLSRARRPDGSLKPKFHPLGDVLHVGRPKIEGGHPCRRAAT